MLPGFGTVATTFIAGVMAVRRNLAKPIGSVSQLQTIRLGARQRKSIAADQRFRAAGDISKIYDLALGICTARTPCKLPAARKFSRRRCSTRWPLRSSASRRTKLCSATTTCDAQGRSRQARQKQTRAGRSVARRHSRFQEKREGCNRVVVLWTGSTEVFRKPSDVHRTLAAFEAGMERNDPEIAPSTLYAWAAMKEGCSYANGAPNLAVETPALIELAHEQGIPTGGKDFKTGQTLIKTVLAPMLKARMLGLSGWFSTNILGNRDGEVLLDPDSFKTKEETKLDVLETILQPELYPDLYKDYYHKVRINYYPPRGDAKESWDNIDIFGWLGYPMQIKVNFLCRDSILAAPLVLDLVLFMDLAQRVGLGPRNGCRFTSRRPQSRRPTLRMKTTCS